MYNVFYSFGQWPFYSPFSCTIFSLFGLIYVIKLLPPDDLVYWQNSNETLLLAKEIWSHPFSSQTNWKNVDTVLFFIVILLHFLASFIFTAYDILLKRIETRNYKTERQVNDLSLKKFILKMDQKAEMDENMKNAPNS